MTPGSITSSSPVSEVRATAASFAKITLRLFAPGLLGRIRSWRATKQFERLQGPLAKKVRAHLYGNNDIKILGGPFRGLRFTDETNPDFIVAKWIGSYESQLHPIVNMAIESGNYQTIINIGAAEGYYAVGLAWRLPRAVVHSYDIDNSARRKQRWLAETNSVKNLRIHGLCTHKELTNRIQGRTLILCDIEGCEYELLDPARCPALTRTDILLELHNPPASHWYEPEPDFTRISALVEEGKEEIVFRFKATHRIQTIRQQEPEQLHWARLQDALTDSEIQKAVTEDRGFAMTWLWMEAESAF